MKELYPMHGIITTVLTPFKENTLEVDLVSFRKEIQTALDAGVSGFLVPCNASEMAELTWDERLLIVRETVAIAKGKALVIPSVSAGLDMDVGAQCRVYLDLGVDGVNINIPYTSDDEYYDAVKKVDALNPPFICLQDATRVDSGLPDDLIVRLFNDFETVRCIKIEVKNSGPKYSRILKATNGRMNVSGARESDQMVEGYDRGMHALMPSGLYELFVNAYKLYHEKDRESAMRLLFDMLPIIVWTRQEMPLNLYFHKHYLKKIGVFESAAMRQPVNIDEYRRRYADEMIDYAIKLRDELPKYWE